MTSSHSCDRADWLFVESSIFPARNDAPSGSEQHRPQWAGSGTTHRSDDGDESHSRSGAAATSEEAHGAAEAPGIEPAQGHDHGDGCALPPVVKGSFEATISVKPATTREGPSCCRFSVIGAPSFVSNDSFATVIFEIIVVPLRKTLSGLGLQHCVLDFEIRHIGAPFPKDKTSLFITSREVGLTLRGGTPADAAVLDDALSARPERRGALGAFCIWQSVIALCTKERQGKGAGEVFPVLWRYSDVPIAEPARCTRRTADSRRLDVVLPIVAATANDTASVGTAQQIPLASPPPPVSTNLNFQALKRLTRNPDAGYDRNSSFQIDVPLPPSLTC